MTPGPVIGVNEQLKLHRVLANSGLTMLDREHDFERHDSYL
jgi:hypothetical protein